jgi:hypothetical protein
VTGSKKQKALENNFLSCYTRHFVISWWKLTKVPSNWLLNINLWGLNRKFDRSDSRRTKKFEKQTKITRKVVIPIIKLFYDEKWLQYAQIDCSTKILCEKDNEKKIKTNQTVAGWKSSKNPESFFSLFSEMIFTFIDKNRLI